jgi:hypothetical protein
LGRVCGQKRAYGGKAAKGAERKRERPGAKGEKKSKKKRDGSRKKAKKKTRRVKE